MWGRQRASVIAVLSPKPFLDSLEEAEMKFYWQWSPEPHSSPVCHPHGCVIPIPHPHVPGTVLKGPNVPDSKDLEGGRKKQWGFAILQQKLNREVKLICTSLPFWVTWAGIELKLLFFICALSPHTVIWWLHSLNWSGTEHQYIWMCKAFTCPLLLHFCSHID